MSWCAFRLVDVGFVMMAERAARNDSRFDDQLVPLLRKTSKIFVGAIAMLVAVQNLGFSVSGLLAGLGIGGLAFALAAKDTIANVFGSVTILVDRPFRVGDWVTLPDADGMVEEVGLRTTRIRTFDKTVVTIPNQTLTNATVENHSLMPRRRVRMTLNVTYATTPAQMRDLLRRLEELLRGHPGVAPENLQVRFLSFGESSLEVLVNYFTITVDYDEHTAIRQELNLAIMDLLDGLGVRFAFPTRTVRLADATGREAGLCARTAASAVPEPLTAGPPEEDGARGDAAALDGPRRGLQPRAVLRVEMRTQFPVHAGVVGVQPGALARHEQLAVDQPPVDRTERDHVPAVPVPLRAAQLLVARHEGQVLDADAPAARLVVARLDRQQVAGTQRHVPHVLGREAHRPLVHAQVVPDAVAGAVPVVEPRLPERLPREHLEALAGGAGRELRRGDRDVPAQTRG